MTRTKLKETAHNLRKKKKKKVPEERQFASKQKEQMKHWGVFPGQGPVPTDPVAA